MSLKRRYIPKRGDLVWINFDPAAGHEQLGKRPAMVLSDQAFNKVIGLALVAPVTSRIRGHGFEVSIAGTKKIEGVVLCQQIKMVDFNARGVTFAEKAPAVIVDDVLCKVRTIVS